MKQFTSVYDAGNVPELIKEALLLKQHINKHAALGKGKTIGLLFLNPSLRTRMRSFVLPGLNGVETSVARTIRWV